MLLVRKDLAKSCDAEVESATEREVTANIWPGGVGKAPWRLKCIDIPPKSAKNRGFDGVDALTFERDQTMMARDINLRPQQVQQIGGRAR